MKSKKTILIVDDENSVRLALKTMLEENHYKTLEAKNGKDGLQIALRDHPDLVLLDILMPDIDGMTMLKLLREDPWGKQVSVFILTNLNPADEQVVRDVVTHKPLHYFIKSDWDLRAILNEINKVFTHAS